MRSTGGVAQWLQRATGLLLLFYLLLHVATVKKLGESPAAFDEALSTFRHPLFKLLEIALLGTVILHALNGVRVTILDLGFAHRRQRQLFWVLAIGFGAAVFIAGAVPMYLNGVSKP